MSKRKSTKRTVATPTNLDPAKLAEMKTLERDRARAARALLKRRQKKSGQ